LLILKAYKTQHSDFNLTKSLFNEVQIGLHTSTQYAISGLLCQLIDQKHGLRGLKKYLISEKSETGMLFLFEKLLNVKQNDFESFLETELKKIN
jgi:hypothetical protein